VYGVDPSLELQRRALKWASGKSSEVTFLPQSAEDRIPLADLSMDTIVITWSLCSIPNPAAALQQMKRVLKRNGQLIFI
jgi:ubiquinone/menaquinone biosynthesis C-methylase UbiE